MNDTLTDAIFNACAAVAMISFTIIIAGMSIIVLFSIWNFFQSDDQRD